MSKSHRAQQKRINRKNAGKAAVRHEKPAAGERSEAVYDPERDREFAEKYGRGGVIKNTLRIWKDSSPATFITYLPVIAFQLAYAVFWFIAGLLVLIPGAGKLGLGLRDAVLFANMVISAAVLPLVVTALHLIYDIRQGSKYYFKSFFRCLFACVIYLILGFVNVVIAVMFTKNAGEQIMGQLQLSITAGLVMIGFLTVLSLIAQLFLMIRRARLDNLRTTKLGLKIDKDK